MILQSSYQRVLVEPLQIQAIGMREHDMPRAALERLSTACDPTTAAHQRRTARYADAIGRRMGLRGAALTALRCGALLHDIGKAGVDAAIIGKPGPLTREEYRAIQEHPIIGEQIVRGLRLATPAVLIVRHHHERWDGGGYPDRLVGAAIPLGARIVAVADAFDAMTSQRAYNQIVSRDLAIARLCAGAGTVWDPYIVRVFIERLRGEGRSEGRDWSQGVRRSAVFSGGW